MTLLLIQEIDYIPNLTVVQKSQENLFDSLGKSLCFCVKNPGYSVIYECFPYIFVQNTRFFWISSVLFSNFMQTVKYYLWIFPNKSIRYTHWLSSEITVKFNTWKRLKKIEIHGKCQDWGIILACGVIIRNCVRQSRIN